MAETAFWFSVAGSLALLARALVSRSGVLVWPAVLLFLLGSLGMVTSGIEVLVWVSLAAQALMVRALIGHSWVMMWLAAVGSFVFSILSMFSIGAVVFALTCVQLASVVALRLRLPFWQEAAILLAGVLIWVLVVPVQSYGFEWLGGFGVYQIVGLVGLLLVALPVGRILNLLPFTRA
jgi:hypothetical protein